MSTEDEFRERLVRMFKKYDPDRLPIVDASVTKFKGNVEQFMGALVKKYGPEPTDDGDADGGEFDARKAKLEERLRAFYSQHDPDKVASVESVAAKYVGKEEQLFKALTMKYNAAGEESNEAEGEEQQADAEEESAGSPTEERLKRFFTQYDPAKLPTVKDMAAKFAGNEKKLFTALVKKYGPEPEEEAAAEEPQEAAAAPADDNAAIAALTERLKRFFTKYDKAKVGTARMVAAKEVGNEKRLFAALTRKYGPEPTADENEEEQLHAAAAEVQQADVPKDQPPPSNRAMSPKRRTGKSAPKSPTDTAEQRRASSPRSPGGKKSPLPKKSPASSRPQTPSSPQNPEELAKLAARLRRFYQKYDAAKVPQSEEMAKKYLGKEEGLFNAMVMKYGPEPVFGRKRSDTLMIVNSEERERLVNILRRYDPGRLGEVDAMLESHKGSEKAFLEEVVQQYGGAEPPPYVPTDEDKAELEKRLKAFYAKYDPNKLSDVPRMVMKYVGQEVDLFKALVLKYGPEPPRGRKRAPTMVLSDNEDRKRLVNILRHYEPTKLSEVDAMLESHKGSEKAFLEEVVQQYGGAEPPPYVPTDEDKAELEKRLKAFFAKYDPPRLANVPRMVMKYVGLEHDLFKSLEKQYGPEPTTVKTRRRSDTLMIVNSEERERLVNILRRYDPGRLGEVDAMLARHKGSEKAFLEEVVQQYGGAEPPPYVPTDEDKAELEKRLKAFYAKYDPNKLSDVPRMVMKYVGQEVDLFKALVLKYGPEPRDWAAAHAAMLPKARSRTRGLFMDVPSSRERLSEFLFQYAPGKLSTIDEMLKDYDGCIEELLFNLTEKYGPEPSQKNVSEESKRILEQRLRGFFVVHDPSRLANIDALVKRYAGHEQEYIAALVARYGPEPTAHELPLPALPNDETSTANHIDVVTRRVTRMFMKYDPAKVEATSTILSQVSGREDAFLRGLVAKYGPEPPEDELLENPKDNNRGSRSKTLSPSYSRLMQRLCDFYEVYEPSRISRVPEIAQEFIEQEDVLFRALEEKYGPEPRKRKHAGAGTTAANENDVPAAASVSEPAVTAAAEGAPREAQIEGKDEEAAAEDDAAAKSRKFRDTPIVKRLRRFYKYYDPGKIQNIPAIVQLIQTPAKEAALFASLVAKYGPEPRAPVKGAHDESLSNGEWEEQDDESVTHGVWEKMNHQQQQRKREGSVISRRFEVPVSACVDAEAAKSVEQSIERARLYAYVKQHRVTGVGSIEQAGEDKPPATTPEAQVAALLETFSCAADAIETLEINYGAEEGPSLEGSSTFGGNLIDSVQDYFDSKQIALSAAMIFATYDFAAAPDIVPYFIRCLEEHFGPEDPPIDQQHRMKLMEVYQKFAPEKISCVDDVLRVFSGFEDKLFDLEDDVFDAMPKPPNHAAQLRKVFEKFCPSKVGTEEEILREYDGREEDVFVDLEAEHGWSLPPLEPMRIDPRERLNELFGKYAPDRMDEIENLLRENDDPETLWRSVEDAFIQIEGGRKKARNEEIRKQLAKARKEKMASRPVSQIVSDLLEDTVVEPKRMKGGSHHQESTPEHAVSVEDSGDDEEEEVSLRVKQMPSAMRNVSAQRAAALLAAGDNHHLEVQQRRQKNKLCDQEEYERRAIDLEHFSDWREISCAMRNQQDAFKIIHGLREYAEAQSRRFGIELAGGELIPSIGSVCSILEPLFGAAVVGPRQ